MDTPGITITPIITQGGERTNAVFLDDLRDPGDRQRIGGENDGWQAITAALNFERMFYHNEAALGAAPAGGLGGGGRPAGRRGSRSRRARGGHGRARR